MDVCPHPGILHRVPHAMIVIAALPDLSDIPAFSLRAEGEASFDALHRALKRFQSIYEQMNVIRHDDELMQRIFLAAVIIKNFKEQLCDPIRLQQVSMLECRCGDEVCGCACPAAMRNGHKGLSFSCRSGGSVRKETRALESDFPFRAYVPQRLKLRKLGSRDIAGLKACATRSGVTYDWVPRVSRSSADSTVPKVTQCCSTRRQGRGPTC